MPCLGRHRFQLVQQSRSTKANTFLLILLALLLCFTTAIEGFSPVSKHSRIQQRTTTIDRNHINDKFRQGALLPHESRGGKWLRPITELRGGFMLPQMDNPFWKSIGIYAVCDFIIGLFLSVFTGSHLHLDLIGSGAFAMAALPYLWSTIAHIRWSSAAVFLWGTKLALFLFYRAIQVKHDVRLTDLLSTPQGSFQFWFVTFVWNLMVSLPYLFGLQSDRDSNLALVSGGALYLLGLTIETLADAQKYFFKQQLSSTTGSQFCNIGLWKYSQHPNWFGNLLLWTGILVMNFPALIEPLPVITSGTDNGIVGDFLLRLWSIRKLILACLGPGFLWILFNGQATGNITNTVELANSKYGKNSEYIKYIKEVPLIIPKIFSQ